MICTVPKVKVVMQLYPLVVQFYVIPIPKLNCTSSVEVDYFDLNRAYKDLLPLISLIHELSAAIILDDSFVSNIRCKELEDNAGVLLLVA